MLTKIDDTTEYGVMQPRPKDKHAVLISVFRPLFTNEVFELLHAAIPEGGVWHLLAFFSGTRVTI